MSTRTVCLLSLFLLPACQPSGSADRHTSAEGLIEEDTGPCRGTAPPEDQAFVADGVCARAVALGQGTLRQLTFSAEGDLIGVRGDGAVVRYRDENDDGRFTGDNEIKTIAKTDASSANNVAFDGDGANLYVATRDDVVRFPYSSTADDLGAGEIILVGEHSSGVHPLRSVKVYDGYLYVQYGSKANASLPFAPETTVGRPDYDTARAAMKRFRIADFHGVPFDWANGELYFAGLRNTIGFTQNPQDGELYGVVSGIDDLAYGGEDVHAHNPGEDLVRLEPHKGHGYPYCFTAAHLQTEQGTLRAGTQLASSVMTKTDEKPFVNPHDDAWCEQNSTEPLTFLPAHSVPLDLVFVNGASALPPAWEGSALVALRGPSDAGVAEGHQVVLVPFAADGTTQMPVANDDGVSFFHEVIFGGKSGSGDWGWSSGEGGEDSVRPVGLAISPKDGALYVSSEAAPDAPSNANGGAIYRIARSEY